VNPFEFYVTGRNGSHYETGTFSDVWGPTFDGGTLHNGEHITGTIVYDVALGAVHGKIGYSPNLDGVPLAMWAY
jgi:hypothetical protein